MNFVLTNVHRHCSKHANTTRPRSRVPFVVPFYPASPNDENVKLERARRQRRVSVSHRRLSVFDVRRTTRFGGEVGWTPCGSAARLPDAGLRRFTLRSRAAGATALSPTITSTGPPASRRRGAAGRARSLRRRRTRAFPTRARLGRLGRVRVGRARKAPPRTRPERRAAGGAPAGVAVAGGAPRSAARFVRRRERSAGRRTASRRAAATSPLPWRGSPGRRLERGVGVFVLGGGGSSSSRTRATGFARFAADADAASPSGGRPARRAAGARDGSGRGPTRGTGTTTGAFVFDT